MTYGIELLDTKRIQLPYSFYSESVPCPTFAFIFAHNLHRFKAGDIKLSVWLEHIVDGERKKVSAFESIVPVVEPELSIFDFKLYVSLPSI